jgi:hypothetical protein
MRTSFQAGTATPILFPSPYCSSCPLSDLCHEKDTILGCTSLGPAHPTLLHPSKVGWIEALCELSGGQFDLPARAQDIPDLPAFIPRILSPARRRWPYQAAAAISLRDVERLAVEVQSTGLSAKHIMGLTADQLLIVLGFEHDRFLIPAWRRRASIIEAINTVQPDLAVAWSYSVWHRHAAGWLYPRSEHLINLKRGFVTFHDLQAAGVPAIPHCYWGIRDDLQRWTSWLSKNPAVTTIAIDLQTADRDADWLQALEDLAYFRANLSREVRVLFSGVCALDRIAQLQCAWPGYSLTNFGALYTAHFRFVQGKFGLRSANPSNQTRPREEIFQAVTQEYSDQIKSFRAGVGTEVTLSSSGKNSLFPLRGREAPVPVWPPDCRYGDVIQLALDRASLKRSGLLATEVA